MKKILIFCFAALLFGLVPGQSFAIASELKPIGLYDPDSIYMPLTEVTQQPGMDPFVIIDTDLTDYTYYIYSDSTYFQQFDLFGPDTAVVSRGYSLVWNQDPAIDSIPDPGHDSIPDPGHDSIPDPGHDSIPVPGHDSISIDSIIYSQITTNYITSSCLSSAKGLDASIPAGINFRIIGDSLLIYGTIEANCCGIHIASITIINDSVFINTADSGVVCLCKCNYSFEIEVPLSTINSIILVNGESYNLKNAITGISNPSTNKIKIYPNPVNDKLYLENSNFLKEAFIVDLKGQLIYKTKNPVNFINVSNLQSGIYLIRLLDKNGNIKSEKLIKY